MAARKKKAPTRKPRPKKPTDVDPALAEALLEYAEVVRAELQQQAPERASRAAAEAAWDARRDAALARHGELIARRRWVRDWVLRLHCADPRERARVLAGLADLDQTARIRTLRVDEPSPATTLLPLLVEVARDPAPEVRAEVAGVLGGFGIEPMRDEREAVVNALVELLDDAATDVRLRAATALGQLGPQAGEKHVPTLVAWLSGEDEALAQAASQALSGCAVEDLRRMLTAGPARARPLAVRALARVARPVAALPRGGLVNARVVRELDRRVLPAMPDLVRALDEPALQVEAARALGAIGIDEGGAVAALARLLAGDAPAAARVEAAHALGLIGRNPDVAVPALAQALSDDATQDAAFDALTRFGRLARMALPALRALRPRDPARRERVRALVERLC